MIQKLSIILLISLSTLTCATTCPNPNTTSLQWGVPPEPWEVNPFSPNSPQGEEGTIFVRANILIAGYGRGVMCTYQNSLGEYSIWWQGPTKIPATTDNYWIKTLGGFICTESLETCNFFVG